jgi:GntR family transcriptional regulator
MCGRWSASRKKLSMLGATHPLRCWISTGSQSWTWRRIASRLRAKPGETLLAVGRLRLADGIPVILERRWLPAALFPGLKRGELRGSIYCVIAEKYHLEITESDQTIRALGIRGSDAKLLQVPSGSAGFPVSAAGYARDRAVWWERTIYRGDSYEFHHHRAAPGRLISIPASGSGSARRSALDW